MERSEWAEPEPAPRWRALLDRALLGRSGENQQVGRARAGHSRGAAATVDGGHTDRPDQAHPDPSYSDEQAYPAGDPRDAGSLGRARPGLPYPGQAYQGRGYPGQAYPGQAYPGQAYQGQQGYPAQPPPTSAGPADQVTSYYSGQQRPARAEPPAHPPPGRLAGQLDPGQIEWRQPARRDDTTSWAIATLRRELAGPKVLAFANPKGGVHKTTATALAAATIGSVRGRGVLAWDDNELRGTLGLRAGSARHARTIRHLIADLAEVEATGGLELADKVDDYLRHASDGTYDVLAGEENPRFAQRLDQFTVRRVLELLRRTHDVICVDTGNNVESPNWQTVLQAADQLVVTTVPREDAAFTADWMLDLLDELGMGQLVKEAVTLLSCAAPAQQPLLEDLRAHFATRTRAVVVVPYDPALESGSSIEPAMLQPATRQSWLHAAATILDPLTSTGRS